DAARRRAVSRGSDHSRKNALQSFFRKIYFAAKRSAKIRLLLPFARDPRHDDFSAVRDRRNHDGKLQRRNFKVVAVRINSGVVVSERKPSGGFVFGVDAGRLPEPEKLRVRDHFARAQTRADALKISVVR